MPRSSHPAISRDFPPSPAKLGHYRPFLSPLLHPKKLRRTGRASSEGCSAFPLPHRPFLWYRVALRDAFEGCEWRLRMIHTAGLAAERRISGCRASAGIQFRSRNRKKEHTR